MQHSLGGRIGQGGFVIRYEVLKNHLYRVQTGRRRGRAKAGDLDC